VTPRMSITTFLEIFYIVSIFYFDILRLNSLRVFWLFILKISKTLALNCVVIRTGYGLDKFWFQFPHRQTGSGSTPWTLEVLYLGSKHLLFIQRQNVCTPIRYVVSFLVLSQCSHGQPQLSFTFILYILCNKRLFCHKRNIYTCYLRDVYLFRN
jgi:hypothetical protein